MCDLRRIVAHPQGRMNVPSDPDDETILDLYQWSLGECFRCARTCVETTHLAEVVARSGVHYDVRACRYCVLVLEGEQRRVAARRGIEYEPGRLSS